MREVGGRLPLGTERTSAAELAERNAELQRLAAELDLLRTLGIAISSILEPAEILRLTCQGAQRLFDVPFTAVVSPFETRGCECGGAGGAELLDHFAPRFREALARGESVVRPSLLAEGAVRAVVAVPLRQGSQTHGALLLGWGEPGSPRHDTVRLAETLGVQVAVSLQNARLVEQMRTVAARRDRFFSAISHDLRTPITAILGYSELLLDGVAGDLGEGQHEMVDRICQVSGHLSQLVGDILDLTRLDAGRVEFHREPVAVGALVEEAVMTVEPQARAKRLAVRRELDGSCPARIRADRFRVRQVLVNLLSNAVKFTPAGEVCVSAGNDGDTTWIAVADTGPGLPPGSEERVFEEFVQLGAGGGVRGEPGSGLGLAISRRLARAMGGDLIACNVPRGGAAFTLRLPLAVER